MMQSQPPNQQRHVCRHCGWEWNSRLGRLPRVCPRCKRYTWQEEPSLGREKR